MRTSVSEILIFLQCLHAALCEQLNVPLKNSLLILYALNSPQFCNRPVMMELAHPRA